MSLSAPTLYRHFDGEGNLLYVGISLTVVQRQIAHSSGSNWFKDVKTITIERFDNQDDMYDAEVNAIINERPLHNVDKAINKDGTPRIRKRPTYQDVRPYGHVDEKIKAIAEEINSASTMMGAIKKIAKECKVSTSTVARIRDGYIPNAATADRLAAYFKRQQRKEKA